MLQVKIAVAGKNLAMAETSGHQPPDPYAALCVTNARGAWEETSRTELLENNRGALRVLCSQHQTSWSSHGSAAACMDAPLCLQSLAGHLQLLAQCSNSDPRGLEGRGCCADACMAGLQLCTADAGHPPVHAQTRTLTRRWRACSPSSGRSG